MKYKIIGVFILLSVLFVSAPKAAKANIWDDFIASLQPQQVAELQSAIALKAVTVNPISVSCLSTTAPSIKVTSPSGGEVYTAGQQITITWTSCNLPENITKISLISAAGGWSGTLASNIPDNGTYTLNLPNVSSFSSATEFSQYFKNASIKIEIAANEINMSASSNLFSIVPPLTLTTPGIATTPAVSATSITSTPAISSTNVPKPSVTSTPAVGVTRGVKVVLVENPGGACKTSSTGQTPSTTSSTGQCASNTSSRWGNLVFHTKSDAVKAFQMVLQNAGDFPTTATADGSYGPITEASVLAFQGISNLPKTGIIDSATADALGALAIQQSQVKPVNIQPANIPVGSIIVSGGSSCTVWSVNSSNVATLLGSGSGAYDQSGVWMGCFMNGIVYHSTF